ncbi:ATP-binding protein [Salipaludibacillus aurantiacus]|uniref:histidine kinase n=1 Tax=Salipaludibacillus aurantiacus TaxID=1601833 RepID=A0A1H9RKU6_9BACI|nr:ATP-binding protein [Salipaludibacillus aurantiacus]SER73481.1 Signal transduction histidine kinase [Salipaludibacillus aurantiacus]
MDKLAIRHMVELLRDKKEHIIKDMVYPFKDILRSKEDLEALKLRISFLFDLFLLKISSDTCLNTADFGARVQEFMSRYDMEVEDFLTRFDEIRVVMESHISSMPVDETNKTLTIAKLYRFFLDLQKEAYLETAKQKNKELLHKDDQLSQLKSDRMEILSKLSSSFAHEIRNPLTSIKGFIKLIEQRMETPVEEKNYFSYIYNEMEELEQQVNQILFLSHEKNHQDIYFTSVSLNQLLYDAVDYFQPLFYQNKINVELNLCENVTTLGIEEQIKLVLYKLMQNAHDALIMKEKNRCLKIWLTKKEADALITFSNNGPPVPALIRQSMFEPFVSTKELGKGLGLAVSKQLMKKHEGDIDYTSKEGWTVFKLRFPVEKEVRQ